MFAFHVEVHASSLLSKEQYDALSNSTQEILQTELLRLFQVYKIFVKKQTIQSNPTFFSTPYPWPILSQTSPSTYSISHLV